MARRQPQMTQAKGQRALDAIVAIIETGPARGEAGTDWVLEQACERIRELMAEAQK